VLARDNMAKKKEFQLREQFYDTLCFFLKLDGHIVPFNPVLDLAGRNGVLKVRIIQNYEII
jgi:hypothetical protein